jgi:cytochrome c biogenesis protein CcdA
VRRLVANRVFAYAFNSRTQLLGRALLFLAGLSTVFVPLGMGASLVAALLMDYRDTTILVAGLVLIGFGVLELVGGGFTLLPRVWWSAFKGGNRPAPCTPRVSSMDWPASAQAHPSAVC